MNDDTNRILPGDIVHVNFNNAQFTLCKSAIVVQLPAATGDSWVFKDTDTGELHYVSEGCSVTKGGMAGPETFRKLCSKHPNVNYKTTWGCPDCVVELREQLFGLIQECEYSASSGLPFNALGSEWTQLAKAKALISKGA